MIRALLLALLGRVLADPIAPVDDVDLVPADCEDCGYPIEYCPCGHGFDLSDYYDYVAAAR